MLVAVIGVIVFRNITFERFGDRFAVANFIKFYHYILIYHLLLFILYMPELIWLLKIHLNNQKKISKHPYKPI